MADPTTTAEWQQVYDNAIAQQEALIAQRTAATVETSASASEAEATYLRLKEASLAKNFKLDTPEGLAAFKAARAAASSYLDNELRQARIALQNAEVSYTVQINALRPVLFNAQNNIDLSKSGQPGTQVVPPPGATAGNPTAVVIPPPKLVATDTPAAQASPIPVEPATETLKPTYEPAAQTYPYDEQTTAPPPLAQDIGAPPDLPVEYDPYQIPTDAEVTAAREASVDAYLTSFPKDAKDPYRTTTQAVNDAIDADITAMAPAPRVAVGQGLSEEQVAQISKEVTLQKARDQTSLSQQRKQANDGDWRFKLSLAPNSNYLYKAAATEQLAAGQVSAAGIMLPLLYTDGVIFPYTPTISTAYRANYSTYDLTHSNYRGYFYQNSAVEEISLTGTFTAQDTSEANYLLAVIHFFRSVTKMFYGATDPMRGAPPPVCFLSGLGQYQFNYHPVLVSNFSYSLPNDVDYIRAGSVSNNGTNLTDRRDRGIAAPTTTTAVLGRLLGIKAPLGGMTKPPPPSTLQINSPTYVPTKMDISLTLLPVQSRSDISKVFNLQQYANGDQLKGGFW
jgi:hypothetical protein